MPQTLRGATLIVDAADISEGARYENEGEVGWSHKKKRMARKYTIVVTPHGKVAYLSAGFPAN